MHKNKPCIAVDAMGGDLGPQVILNGALFAASKREIRLILVGKEDVIHQELEQQDTKGVDLEVVHAEEVAEMDAKPSQILRRKKNTSIQEAFRLVKNGRADGVVSAGNSGATLACGMFTLGRVKGIDRPALASIMPTEKNPLVLIDVGANVDCKPRNLMQFGIMADVLAKDVLHLEAPRVGIVSIGEEEGKGNNLVKEAYPIFAASSLNFVGNAEGRDLFNGGLDIAVCDGFVGNVALKLSEGLSSSLSRILKRELKRTLFSKLGSSLARKAFQRFALHVDYAEYGGAPILGLNGIAIVCHGSSNSKAIFNAMHMAATFVKNKANEDLSQGLSENKELAVIKQKDAESKNEKIQTGT